MSTSNNHLNATPIVDKNGNKTTVYKRPEGKGWATGKPAAPVARAAVVSSPSTPATGFSGLAGLAEDSGDGTTSRGAQIAERLGELWRQGSAFPEWTDEETIGALSAKFLAIRGEAERLHDELVELPSEDVVEALQHPDFPTGLIELHAFAHPEVVFKQSAVAVAESFKRRRLYKSEIVADENFLTALRVLREHRMDDLKRHCEEHPEHNWYIESDSQWFVPRYGHRSTLTGDVFDLDGHNYQGKNIHGLTREEATTAAEHGIDPDLMRSLIDGE